MGVVLYSRCIFEFFVGFCGVSCLKRVVNCAELLCYFCVASTSFFLC